MIEWRSLPGYPQYEVSEYGAVRRTVDDVNRLYLKGHVLKPSVNRGYVYYTLTDDKGVRNKVRAHRAVALAFHGDPPEGKTNALHRDDIKSNNHFSNLYWGSRSDNIADADRNGIIKHGADHPYATLTDEIVNSIRSDYVPEIFGYKQLAKKYGISRDKVKSIILRRSYKTFEVE